MIHKPVDSAARSWSDYRRTYAHHALHFPELSVFVPLIDRIVDQGFGSSLYASSSHNRLVISDAERWDRKKNRIVVIPKRASYELNLIMKRELVEQVECDAEHLFEELDRLLPRLLQNAKRT